MTTLEMNVQAHLAACVRIHEVVVRLMLCSSRACLVAVTNNHIPVTERRTENNTEEGSSTSGQQLRHITFTSTSGASQLLQNLGNSLPVSHSNRGHRQGSAYLPVSICPVSTFRRSAGSSPANCSRCAVMRSMCGVVIQLTSFMTR